MTSFELFTKTTIARARAPRVTQRRGTIVMNAAAHAAIGSPDAVELVLLPHSRALAIRPCHNDRGGLPVRPAKHAQNGPFIVSATALLRRHGLDPADTRLWAPRLVDGALHVDLDLPIANDNERAPAPQRRRPSPRRQYESPASLRRIRTDEELDGCEP